MNVEWEFLIFLEEMDGDWLIFDWYLNLECELNSVVRKIL